MAGDYYTHECSTLATYQSGGEDGIKGLEKTAGLPSIQSKHCYVLEESG